MADVNVTFTWTFPVSQMPLMFGFAYQGSALNRCAGGKRSRLVASVKPRPGLALLHLHGDDCLEHEGAEVLFGVKYVLRSDVLF
jgi:hypothetical protein